MHWRVNLKFLWKPANVFRNFNFNFVYNNNNVFVCLFLDGEENENDEGESNAMTLDDAMDVKTHFWFSFVKID